MSRYAWGVFFLIVCLILSGTHWKAFVMGRQLNEARHAQALAAASERARAREQQLAEEKQKVEVRYEALKKSNARAVAGAQHELDRLRQQLAAADSAPAPSDSASAPRAYGGAGIEAQLLGSCAGALVGMAAEADRLAAQVIGLQSYVSRVCLAK